MHMHIYTCEYAFINMYGCICLYIQVTAIQKVIQDPLTQKKDSKQFVDCEYIPIPNSSNSIWLTMNARGMYIYVYLCSWVRVKTASFLPCNDVKT